MGKTSSKAAVCYITKKKFDQNPNNQKKKIYDTNL